MTARLRAEALTLRYGDRTVVDGLDLAIPDGEFTIIVGPNGCGKSTLLKALARTLPASSGRVLLDERPIRSYRSKEVARRVAMLPQSPIAPDTITVRDLVARGRYPHTTMLRQWSPDDEQAVADALRETDTIELADRLVSELSGGQRQRVWIALVLAQRTDIVLLDEPTTFLDIGHQHEVLELCERLRGAGRTLVAVLHDLNQAARFAGNLVVMREGAIVASGRPDHVLTAELVSDVFALPCRVIADDESGAPLVVPRTGASRPG
jgi:iron complex transport system ATP-binding protein